MNMWVIILCWVILGISIAVKVYTKKKLDNIDGYGGKATRKEIREAKRERRRQRGLLVDTEDLGWFKIQISKLIVVDKIQWLM